METGGRKGEGVGSANEPMSLWGEARPEPAGGQVFKKVKSLTLNENPLPAHRPVSPTPNKKQHKPSNKRKSALFLRRPNGREVSNKAKETNALRCLVGRPNVPAVPEPQVPFLDTSGTGTHEPPERTCVRKAIESQLIRAARSSNLAEPGSLSSRSRTSLSTGARQKMNYTLKRWNFQP